MKSVPTIHKFMTVMPHTIGIDQTLEKAEKMMTEYRIRHLPVLSAGKLIGIVTDRDLRLVESFKDVDPRTIKVEEAYTPEPYITSPQTPITDVCKEMAEHKYGCALVVDNNKLVGIFTWIDALQAMVELMDTRLK